MNNALFRILVSTLVGLGVTLPFVLMEYVYSAGFQRGIPIAIFTILWLESTVFTYVAISVYRTMRMGSVINRIFPLLWKLVGLIVIILSWSFIVNDQMPCFLGGRGC